MKAKFGSIIVAGSGKIGGHVVSHNRSGAYIRTRVKPVNPQTSYQTNARALFSAASQSWASLTNTQRASWINASSLQARQNSLGDKTLLSGKALYTSIYINLSLIGVTPLVTPVPVVSSFSFSSMSAVADNSSHLLTLTFTAAIPVTHKILVYATPVVPAGQTFVKNKMRNFVTMSSTSSSPCELGTPYESRLGSIAPVGDKIHLQFISIEIASGIASFAGSCVTTIVA